MNRVTARCVRATLLMSVAVCGCREKAADAKSTPVPMVAVAPPVERNVTFYEEAQGRVEPVQSLEVRARVSGHLNKILFTPGTEIEPGTPLFEIDPEPFKAALATAKGELAKAIADVPAAEAAVARAEARTLRTKADLRRSETMLKSNAIAQEEYDKANADFLEAQATVSADKAKVESSKSLVDAARAKVKSAELDLGYCSISSPIAGRIGDRLVTEGNPIAGGTGNTTLLTTIVSMDPIYIAYDIDENTLQRIIKAEKAGQIKNLRKSGEIPTEASLAIHGKKYPLKGVTRFVDNKVDPKTGTIRLKALFDNPKPEKGARELAPGMFAKVRLPMGDPRKSILVPDSAVLSDQGTPYILVVGEGNKATRLDIQPGPVDDTMRVVEAVRSPNSTEWRPLKADERFIISGLQRVRPGMVVDPTTPAK